VASAENEPITGVWQQSPNGVVRRKPQKAKKLKSFSGKPQEALPLDSRGV